MRICLECRTVCRPTCPYGHSRVGDREQLVDEVWGGHRVAAVAPVGSTESSWSGWDIFAIVEIDWVALLIIPCALLWFLGAAIVKLFRKRAALREAQGVPPTRWLSTGQIGYVVDGDAYGCELRYDGAVMLRDGITTGLEVRLESGSTVRVPAGACAFDLTNAPRMRDVEAYLAEIDPTREEPDPFHHDDARRVTLEPGDRVELLCALEPRAGAPAGYRDSTTTLFAPRGIVRLRRL